MPEPLGGVYTIRNRITGRAYVGSTGHIAKRWCAHRSQLRNGKHHNPGLQADWDRCGETAFVWTLEYSSADFRQTWHVEVELMDLLRATPGGLYNIKGYAATGLPIYRRQEA